MSPELFLGIVAVVLGFVALFISLAAYTGVRSMVRKSMVAREKALQAESRNLSMVFYMEDSAENLKRPDLAMPTLVKFITRLLTALLIALWREGVITSDQILQMQPLAGGYLERLFPEIFGSEKNQAPPESQSPQETQD